MGNPAVLIVHHGLPPRPGAAVSGIGLRAWTLGEGLRAHGLAPCYATRERDRAAAGLDEPGDGGPAAPLGFEGPDDLQAIVAEAAPAVVIAVAPAEVSRLPEDGPPVVLDLFAPRLLERQFQHLDDDDEVIRLLDAIGRADQFLFSNPRQRDFHLGLLAAAGVDCRTAPGLVVPLACPPDTPRRAPARQPVLVAGGVWWPWHDARAPLRTVIDHLERRGRGTLHLYGGPYPLGDHAGTPEAPGDDLPDSAHLVREGFVPYDELLRRYGRATAALDLARPNVERELSFSFRHVDYLRCGLPLLLGSGSVAADQLVPAGAALAVDVDDEAALRGALDRLLDDPPLRAAMTRAARRRMRAVHAWDRAVAPLAAYCAQPRLRRRKDALLPAIARDRDDLDRELGLARRRLADLERRVAWTQQRLDDAEQQRQKAWRHHRRTVARLDEAWAAHGAMLAERDEAWRAHAGAVAELTAQGEQLRRTEARREELLRGLEDARDQIRDFEVELRRVKAQLDQTIGWRAKRFLDRLRDR